MTLANIMQLKSLKLSGFKSFVDLTTIPILSSMNAIVGPNGCGKSNIVDAIRWVIGETSAKQLRGQSMTDVIFNGSSQRKPVGKAAVELTFDNSDGRIVGEFAKYNEIAIRREVEREGQSSYFINSTLCRRKDIIDLFLGTGLGPRSYSIIEQGMVSQLIEAKPEDLRVYLEEAAGISKYKERRRETESRIGRTKENLERLSDLCEELAKQLRNLNRQANAAERYKVYKEEERLLQAQIKALQWQALEQKSQVIHEKILAKQTELEKVQAELQSTETELEKGRVLQTELSDNLNQRQKAFYGLGADIARLEQQIKFSQDKIVQWQSESAEVNENLQELTDSTLEHQQQIHELSKVVQELSPQQSAIATKAIDSNQQLEIAEESMQEWQISYEQNQNEFAHTRQRIEVVKTKIEHGKNEINQLQNRLQQIARDIENDEITQLSAQIEPLLQQVKNLESACSEINFEREQIREMITATRDAIIEAKSTLAKNENVLREKEVQHAKLTALQQSALESTDQQTVEWLNRYDLISSPRLGKLLQVNSGWELATETVLSHYLDAVCVENSDDYLEGCYQLAKGSVTILDKSPASTNNQFNKAPTLASQVNCTWPIEGFLKNIYIVDTLDQAKNLRPQLSSDESIITKDGIWLGKNWLRIAKAKADEDSILIREKSLKSLDEEIDELRQILAQNTVALKNLETKLAELENNREIAHQHFQQRSLELNEVQKQLAAKQSRLQHLQQMQQRLIDERANCQNQQEIQQQKLNALQQDLQADEQKMQAQIATTDSLQQQRDELRYQLEQIRQKATEDQKRVDEFSIRLSSNEEQLTLLQQTMARSQRQIHQLEQRRDTLQQQLEASAEPLQNAEEQLQSQLNDRVELERQLTEAEQQLNGHQHRMKSLDQKRHECSELIQARQSELQNCQMERQAITVRQTTIIETLTETEHQLQQVIETMPEEAVLSTWESNAAELAQKITRLGPINLAAIEEFKVISERKEYLDKQQADLNEALQVLEDAIKKIDRETKLKFKETYDKVNEQFQSVFPRIFGGGSASLEMLDDDILSTGILVRAQPPGKRNSTIHMLSGGEKALTALSLIFAMFQLNPAPFCVLDEVDAPLDDVNVGRFCSLVKEMAKQTQFIIVSHNKVTISNADQMMGVTMQEAGVSRIVSVDMEKAMAMVEA